MKRASGTLSSIWAFYRDSFRNMTWVSFLIPFVLAYIVFAWRAMDCKKITRAEIEGTENKY